jgi:hypothetical protein
LVGSKKLPASIFKDEKYGDPGKKCVDIWRERTSIGGVIDISGEYSASIFSVEY